jgi:cold shock CspA family protein
MYKGRLDKWDAVNGYGFIRSDELTSDTFIHISALKNMSRQPVAGDFIFFDVEENKGKKRATRARIEGVKVKFPSENTADTETSPINLTPYFVVISILIALFIFFKLAPYLDNLQPVNYFTSSDNTPQKNYVCDGRQHCSQMTSREEAVFFIQNCPNTKMDGDYDGVPCENDSRF